MDVGMLGFGGAEIGFEGASDHTVDALIGTALEFGVNVIDTAAMYADSEEKIGRALQGRRGQFLLFTKCGRFAQPPHHPTGFFLRALCKLRRSTGFADQQESLDWHPRALEWNIEQSLRRLKTDCIDLIQLHSCSVETLRRGDVIEVLLRVREAGKARHIGYSGDGEAASYAIQCGHFEALQISINVADQEPLDLNLPLAIKHGIGVIAKRPIANGLWRGSHSPDAPESQPYWDRLQKLQYEFLRGEHAFETALRFTLSVPGVHTAIEGTTSEAHLRRNIESASAGCLTQDEFDVIRARWKEVARENWVGQM
ncbi:MAG TPA: aldo/keto reductase [Methylomirabilota bacterium]|nr:aldo/keto reductase [Methylomirabilota bacterium]